MGQLQKLSSESGLDPKLKELAMLRASQINGCVFCLDLHTRRAQKLGESLDRLMLLTAWREATVYSDREKAAFAWTEALTDLAHQPVSDEAYAAALKHFEPKELVSLTVSIATINAWNRINGAFAVSPGALGNIV
jgi:AhpD family alkylhydroperoxidase